MPLLADPNAFADYPLDKTGHRRRDAAWLEAALASDDAQLVLFHRMQAFAGKEGAAWLTGRARDALCGADALTLFLGADDAGRPHFAAEVRDVGADFPLADMGAFEDLRVFASRGPAAETAILGCAKALFEWHARHRFCANCGAPSRVADGGWKRVCDECRAEHFPRVDPVVIMLPVLGDKCCLGRQKQFPKGMFSALAGFVEPGESLEEACAREVSEEVGLRALAVRYLSSQPWPFPSSLMIGLIAEVEGGETTLDPEEIDEICWLTREEARAALSGGVTLGDGRRVFAPPPLAIANRILSAWANDPG